MLKETENTRPFFVTFLSLVAFRLGEGAEVGVSQNSSQVSLVAQIALRTMPFFQLLCNLRCALCLFFQRLRNLRLRIGKSNICCAFIANFFQDAQSQTDF